MKNKILVVLFTLIALYACKGTKNKKPEFTLASFADIHKLNQGLAYDNDSLKLTNPRWIRFHPDSFLVIQEMGTPFLIQIVDLKNGQIQKLIPRGKGKDEMVVAWGIELTAKSISVFDGMQKKIFMLSPSADRKFHIEKSIQLDNKNVISGFPLSNFKFVSLTGIHEKSRLTYFDDNGKTNATMGDFPELENNKEFKSDNNIFSAYTAGNPDGTRLVLACTNTDVLEIYDTSKGLLTRFQGPEGISLTAKEENIGVGTITMTLPAFRGFGNAQGNAKEFWVSYSGAIMQKDIRPKAEDILPKQIFVFSWKGEPLKRFVFTEPIISFSVDWSNQKIYCLSLADGRPKILIYNYKNIANA